METKSRGEDPLENKDGDKSREGLIAFTYR